MSSRWNCAGGLGPSLPSVDSGLGCLSKNAAEGPLTARHRTPEQWPSSSARSTCRGCVPSGHLCLKVFRGGWWAGLQTQNQKARGLRFFGCGELEGASVIWSPERLLVPLYTEEARTGLEHRSQKLPKRIAPVSGSGS